MSPAEYLLKYFPMLWEQVASQADDALHGNRASQPGAGRHGQGSHSDQTAERGQKLAEANTLAGQLERVQQWIDRGLHPRDRPLLLAVWRGNRYGGWWWVSKEMSLGVIECQQRWIRMTEQLSTWMKN